MEEAVEKKVVEKEGVEREGVEKEVVEKEGVEKEVPSTSKRKAEWFDIDEDHNTYVYVSGLPSTFTDEDFVDLMKKYGIISKKLAPGQPLNIKLYKNKDGTIKGDGLCCYVRVESVDLAVTNLDGYLYGGKYPLHCERAKFELKGSYDPSKKPRGLDKRAKIKQKKTVDKLLSWEPKAGPKVQQKKVILKHMFTPDEIAEDATLILDIREDVETKCVELMKCEPKKVEIFDKNPEGVIAVTFAEAQQAEQFSTKIDGEYYAGRVIRAELWDGKTIYKMKETDEEKEEREKKWHGFIENPEDDDEKNSGQPTKNDETNEQPPVTV